MNKAKLRLLALSSVAGVAFFAPAANAQTFSPTVPWGSAGGAAVVHSGTAGVGPLLDPTADLLAKNEYTANSWWATGYFTLSGQKLGYVYHMMLLNTPNGQLLVQNTSMTNATTGAYYSSSDAFPVTPGMVSSTELNIVTPKGIIKGNFDNLQVTATINGAAFDLRLRAASKAMFNGGAGIFALVGVQAHEYSVPVLATTGTITVDGNTYSVTGNSWFDRQWQNGDPDTVTKWCWLGINLTNGDALSVWYSFDDKIGRNRSFATILHGDGSQTAAAAKMTIDTSGNWQSPATGFIFPLSWKIDIPQLNTSLKAVSTPKNQEIVSSTLGGLYEGVTDITGIYKGKPTAGVARLELFGPWE